jgi:hypothetical protein
MLIELKAVTRYLEFEAKEKHACDMTPQHIRSLMTLARNLKLEPVVLVIFNMAMIE